MATARLILDDDTAARHGFPPPREGLLVKDASGRVWQWKEEESNGLGDLGFWETFVGLAVPLIGGIFGVKSGAQQAAAVREQARAAVEIEQLRLQAAQAQAQAVPWNLILIVGAGALVLFMMK